MEKQDSDYRKPLAILKSIPLIITISTGGIYFLGFLKCFCILKSLEAPLSVVDVYSTTYIFSNGLFLLFSLLFVPCLCYVCAKFVKKVSPIKVNRRMREKHKFIGYAIPQVFPWMLLTVFIKLLTDFMNGYLFKPLFIYKIIGRMVFSLNSYLMLFFMMTAEIDVKRKRHFCLGILMAVWSVSLCITYVERLNMAEKNNDIQMYAINQDITTKGVLVTSKNISDESVKKNDDYYTKGRLISRREGTYYWQCENKDMYLIPEDQVVLFEVSK